MGSRGFGCFFARNTQLAAHHLIGDAMHYDLKIGEKTSRVEMTEREEGEGTFVVDGRTSHVLYTPVSSNHFHLVVDGKAAQVFVSPGQEGKYVFIKGRHFLVQDGDRPADRGRRRKAPDQVGGEITPPMPSVVVKVLVQENQRVEKGQGVVVLSAMKMETTLAAPKSGRVVKVNAEVGDKASPGDLLVEIEEERALEHE